jgi:hypothetical protein
MTDSCAHHRSGAQLPAPAPDCFTDLFRLALRGNIQNAALIDGFGRSGQIVIASLYSEASHVIR